MTSTPVMSSIGSVNITASQLNTTQTSGKADGLDFKNFLNQSGANLTGNLNDLVKNVKSVKSTDTKETAEVKEGTQADTTANVTETSKPEDLNKPVEKEEVNEVKDAIDEVEEKISEELDVTVEEIEDALETLGLTQFALLDANKLPEIVAELTGSEDVLALTTDENLYEALTDITEMVEETVNNLAEDLNIPEEELTEAVKEFEDVLVKEETPKETKNVELKAEKTDVKPFEEKITVTNNRKAETLTEKDDAPKDLSETEKVTDKFEEKETFSQGESFDSQKETPMTFAENLLAKAAEALNESEQTVTYTSFDAENIYNQITEAIEVNVSEETSEISLRLHPESLGSVSVKVSANNEGAMTATFTAQNESVKAVIEAQAVSLKETLESKGVTVEAVEVTVQSHEFERNLSDQNKGSREENHGKRRGIRRINLSEPLEESEDTEDSLVREMMAQNGSTIDYSA